MKWNGAFPDHAVILAEVETSADYESSGAAVAFDEHSERMYLWAEYSCCSCNVPEDQITGGSEATLELAIRRIGEHQDALREMLKYPGDQ